VQSVVDDSGENDDLGSNVGVELINASSLAPCLIHRPWAEDISSVTKACRPTDGDV